jgi:hypothetical protein
MELNRVANTLNREDVSRRRDNVGNSPEHAPRKEEAAR